MTDVTVPDELWDDGQEGVLGTWFYASGEHVSAGQVIGEVLTEKVAHEIEAPASGTLTLVAAEEEPIRRGQTIARIE
ncbi:MAG: lipoyl domain-containing protein [Pseudomonadota bacterium]